MTIKKRYEKIGGRYAGPYISLLIINSKGKKIKAYALLDSGSKSSIVPKTMSLIWGLQPKESSKTKGLGGIIKTKNSILRCKINNLTESHTMEIPVKIIDDINCDVPFILGRDVIFDSFNITFRHSQKKILLDFCS